MAEAETRPPPLPPRLDWFVHTQMGPLAGAGIPEWFHGTISREAAENLLEPQPLGSFLIRVSHSHVGYTLSYKAEDCCRHFMVKLLEDGRLAIPGEEATHPSLEALVAFHRQKPLRPHQELLGEACGQKDPENVDYEDLFLYFYAVAEEAASPTQDPREHQGLSSVLAGATKEAPSRPVLHRSREVDTQPPKQATSPCPPKVPFEEAREKLWRNLKTLPQSSRRVRQQLRSHLRALSLSALWEPRRSSAVAPGLRSAADGQEHAGRMAWKDSIPKEPCVATAFENPTQPQTGSNAPSRKATRVSSWSEAAPGTRHQPVLRALSSQEPRDLAEPQDNWLPEEYLPPPPFAPGYC